MLQEELFRKLVETRPDEDWGRVLVEGITREIDAEEPSLCNFQESIDAFVSYCSVLAETRPEAAELVARTHLSQILDHILADTRTDEEEDRHIAKSMVLSCVGACATLVHKCGTQLLVVILQKSTDALLDYLASHSNEKNLARAVSCASMSLSRNTSQMLLWNPVLVVHVLLGLLQKVTQPVPDSAQLLDQLVNISLVLCFSKHDVLASQGGRHLLSRIFEHDQITDDGIHCSKWTDTVAAFTKNVVKDIELRTTAITSLLQVHCKVFDHVYAHPTSSELWACEEYWEMIIEGLWTDNSSSQKFASFLLKRIIALYMKREKSLPIPMSPYFNFPPISEKRAFQSYWDDFFLLYQSMQESYVHLMEPTLHKLSLFLTNEQQPLIWPLVVLQQGITNINLPVRRRLILAFLNISKDSIKKLSKHSQFHNFITGPLFRSLSTTSLLSNSAHGDFTSAIGESLVTFIQHVFVSAGRQSRIHLMRALASCVLRRKKNSTVFSSFNLLHDSNTPSTFTEFGHMLPVLFLFEAVCGIEDQTLLADTWAMQDIESIIMAFRTDPKFRDDRAKLAIKRATMRILPRALSTSNLSFQDIAQIISSLLDLKHTPSVSICLSWLVKINNNVELMDDGYFYDELSAALRRIGLSDAPTSSDREYSEALSVLVALATSSLDKSRVQTRVGDLLSLLLGRLSHEKTKDGQRWQKTQLCVTSFASILKQLREISGVSYCKLLPRDMDVSLLVDSIITFMSDASHDSDVWLQGYSILICELLERKPESKLSLCDRLGVSTVVIPLFASKIQLLVENKPVSEWLQNIAAVIALLHSLRLLMDYGEFYMEENLLTMVRALDFSDLESSQRSFFDEAQRLRASVLFKAENVTGLRERNWLAHSLESLQHVSGNESSELIKLIVEYLRESQLKGLSLSREQTTDLIKGVLSCLKEYLGQSRYGLEVATVVPLIFEVLLHYHSYYDVLASGMREFLLTVRTRRNAAVGLSQMLFKFLIRLEHDQFQEIDELLGVFVTLLTWGDEFLKDQSASRIEGIETRKYQEFGVIAAEHDNSNEPEMDQTAASAWHDHDWLCRVHGNCVLLLLDSRHANFARQIIVRLLHGMQTVSKSRARFLDSQEHRIQVRSIMSINILLQRWTLDDVGIRDAILETMLDLLRSETHVSTRYFAEWTIVRLLDQHHTMFSKVLSLLTDFNCKAPTVVSVLDILVLFAKLVPQDHHSLHESLRHTRPWVACNVSIVKQVATFAFRTILDRVDAQTRNRLQDSDPLVQFILSNNDSKKHYDKYRKSYFLNQFHPINCVSVDTIFRLLPVLGGLAANERVSALAFVRILDKLETKRTLNTPLRICRNEDGQYGAWETWKFDQFWQSKDESLKLTTDIESENTTLQRKPVPWETMLELDLDLSDLIVDKQKQSRSQLIIVASLISKAPNLGGMCRTAEIFGAGLLVLPNKEVVSDGYFTSTAMTSQNWMPLAFVHPKNLKDYLEGLQRENHTIVAVEQTSNSVPLDTFKFPKKTVLLLGDEGKGVPAELLNLCDCAVEIRQFGIVRSLNVHVAGSLFIHNYAMQHLT